MILIPSQSRTVPGTPARIVVIGDSLSALNGPAGSWTGFLAPALATAALAAVGPAPMPSGSLVSAAGLSPTAPHVWLNIAVSGTNCLDMESANIPAQVTALKPDVILWCAFGRNCVVGRLGSGNPSRATCAANHLDIVSRCISGTPGVQVLMTSPVCEGEQWPDGSNANDAEMDAQDGIQATAAGLAGAQYLSVRSAFFAQEQVVNPTKLNVGVMSVDGVHIWHTTSPSPAVNGQLWFANQVLPLFGFTK